MNTFYDDFYRKEIDTIIKSSFEEDGRHCLQIQQNIFYPHGGGQKGDKGKVTIDDKEFHVLDTMKDQYSDDGVLLIIDDLPAEDLKEKTVKCQLDWEFRYKQMRLHTAVHFHHCMLEKVNQNKVPHPKVSDIQDGFAFNRYDNKGITEEMVNAANKEFLDAIKKGATVTTYADPDKKGFRWWECLGFKIPCGGTHVSNLSEIGDVDIEYSKKKGQPTINIKLK
jgi:Ser-tRNA(Ala) deacylase AlaX